LNQNFLKTKFNRNNKKKKIKGIKMESSALSADNHQYFSNNKFYEQFNGNNDYKSYHQQFMSMTTPVTMTSVTSTTTPAPSSLLPTSLSSSSSLSMSSSSSSSSSSSLSPIINQSITPTKSDLSCLQAVNFTPNLPSLIPSTTTLLNDQPSSNNNINLFFPSSQINVQQQLNKSKRSSKFFISIFRDSSLSS
jgi:hypothetical protein